MKIKPLHYIDAKSKKKNLLDKTRYSAINHKINSFL